ncbi:MAG: hypothetical protein GY739_07375 [Mesoflavibacter sp.]|nr:hypothetical protein [Mesoflavibacter sp.]
MEILELRNKILRLKIKWVDRQQYEAASDIREIQKALDNIIDKHGIEV